jgi:Ca2+-binding RTX toxin-like protein
VNTSAKGSAAVASGLSAAIGQVTYDTTNSQMVINANADNLISTSDYVINVNAAATAANSIVEGDINFTLTGGSAGDVIVAGAGADTINGG